MNYLYVPKPLSLNKIPSYLDVLQGFIHEKAKWMSNACTREEPRVSIIAGIVTEKLQRIYRAAEIETIRKDKIKSKVVNAYNSRLTLLKISRSERHKPAFLKKKAMFESRMSNTFQVASSNAIPRQRNKSSNRSQDKGLFISQDVLDKKRPAAILSRQKSYAVAMEEEEHENMVVNDEVNDEYDPDYELQRVKKSSPKKQMDMSEIVEVKSRYSSSCREVSAIVNATLRSVGLEPSVDKSTIQRAEKRKFKEIEEAPVTFTGGLYYDSRKDLSIFSKRKKTEDGFKFYRVIKRQEHYSLVSEPGGTFLGFVNAKDGTADNGSNAILSFVDENKLFDELIALGSDGANTNVGSDGGINRLIELAAHRPLHWFVCMLHLNELPLKALITKLDGKTTGANSFSGPIGNELHSVCNLPIVAFKRFRTAQPLEKLPDPVYKKLSNDQKYLYNVVNALISGKFTESLKQTNIGKINHSRWLTTASRMCRFYAASKSPSDTLKTLTSYIVNVYAPTWFRIKKHELAVNGPENLFFLIGKTELIANERARSIVQKCIRRNAFFAHSENVLLAQLASENKSERIDAVQKILKIRERESSNQIRRFRVPKINFRATSFTEMAVYNTSNLFDPPLTRNMSRKDLLAVIKRPLIVPKFKCHTQMVERAVKEVTRVSLKAVDHRKRNAIIKTTLLNRSKFPKFDSLKDHFSKDVVSP